LFRFKLPFCGLFLAVVTCSSGCVQESKPGDPQAATALLVGLLTDQSPEVRRTAAESIGKIGEGSAVSAVMPLLRDPSALVRATAAKALGRIGAGASQEVVPGLIRSLSDPDEAVRRAAAQALGEVDPPAALLAQALELLRAPDVHVRRAAVLAFTQVEAQVPLAALEAAARDADPFVRQGAVAALGEIGGSAAQPTVQARAMDDPVEAVRVEAVYRLEKIADETGQALLKRIAETDREATVRRWARGD